MGYDATATSIFGSLYFVGGTIGGIGLGLYVQKTRRVRLAMISVSIVSIFGPILFLAMLYTDKVWAVSTSSFLLGL